VRGLHIPRPSVPRVRGRFAALLPGCHRHTAFAGAAQFGGGGRRGQRQWWDGGRRRIRAWQWRRRWRRWGRWR
jgi:hypothetical protein